MELHHLGIYINNGVADYYCYPACSG